MGLVLDVMTSRTDAAVLFIVDSVHLLEKEARAIYDHWRQCGNGSELLMLGRRVTKVDLKGRQQPLSELENKALDLTAGADDLVGVFARLWKTLRPGTPVPVPPREASARWETLFGADLVAFSAAVIRRIDSLEFGQWELEPQDAVDYVREAYLNSLTQSERANLIRVAVLATLETQAPQEVLEREGFERLLELGVVHRFGHGEHGEFIRFYLHQGMGRLLLAAELPRVDQLSILIEAAQRYPFCGMVIAARLEAEKRRDDAIAVLRRIEAPPALTEAIVRSGLQYTLAGCRRLEDLEVVSLQEIDKRLCEDEGALDQGLLRTPLGAVSPFIEYAEKKLPGLMATVARQLGQEHVVGMYARAACASPWSGFVSFLRASPNAEAVVAQIDKAEWEAKQLTRAPQQADFVLTLFQRLRTYGRGDLAQAPARVLVRHPNPQHWHGTGMGLHHVGTVLMLARSEETETKLQFLRTVVTTKWLELQYKNPKTNGGTIATALYTIWSYQTDQVLNHFRIPELASRVQREMTSARRSRGQELSWAIQLLGCAALCRVEVPSSPTGWPDNPHIEEAVAPHFLRVLREERTEIDHVQVQVGLGLREMARLRGADRVVVSADVGGKVLDLWRRARGATPRQSMLNALMIEWLEACAKAGWRLEPDPVPLADLVAARAI